MVSENSVIDVFKTENLLEDSDDKVSDSFIKT